VALHVRVLRDHGAVERDHPLAVGDDRGRDHGRSLRPQPLQGGED
jgi:hypothetical protein